MKKYRPSNGTEGDIFMCKYCYQCIHEKWSHTQNDNDKKCDILSATMVYGLNDKEYPIEWQVINGHPTCTNFIKWDWDNDGNPDDPDNPKAPTPPAPINQLDIFPLYPNELTFSIQESVIQIKQ